MLKGIEDIRREGHKVVVGQEKMIERLLIGLICQRAYLIRRGVPGGI